MKPSKICILTSNGEISHTIVFAEQTQNDDNSEQVYHTNAKIHPDDSIRTIKMKLLYELHKGVHANKIQLRPSYEELYLYGFAKEKTTTLQLFDALKTEDDTNPSISRHTIKQIIEGHPEESSIIRKLPEGDNIPYSEFESALSEKNIEISVKTPLGITFAGGYRDATFEVDPFNVEKHRAYLAEHNNLHYLDDSLLLNHGILTDNTVYVCLADRVYEKIGKPAEEYTARYYFPGLYKEGIKSKETLIEKRGRLVKSTQKLLSDEREQYYESIDMFYKISEDGDNLQYISQGIKNITLQLKNQHSHHVNLEMLFKNMHCSREVPYIKFNPGNRREKLYRFYFERTTRTGKKIPYLSRSHIMRMAKETGRGQQISVYLEGAILNAANGLNKRILSNCYLNFDINGNVQLQLTFYSAIDENTLDDTIREQVLPYISKIGRDVRETGFVVPEYHGLRNIVNTKVVAMTFVCKTAATKNATLESIPCIYSICTLNANAPGQPLIARLKRVENFKEMDAAHILIAELYGQVQYGELGLEDIVGELVSRGLSEDENAAKMVIAGFLATINEMNGEIVEKPGFPLEMKVDSDDKTVEIEISELTSIYYLDTVGVYVDAIIKSTQIYKETNPLLKQLKKLCKKALKFKEQEKVPEDAPKQVPIMVNEGPLKLTKFAKDDDFFAQFESDEGEDEDEIQENGMVEEDAEEDSDDENLLDKLRKNAKQIGKPIMFDDEEDAEGEETEEKVLSKKGPILFEEPDLDQDELPVKEKNTKPVPNKKTEIDAIGRIMQFHSKSALLKPKDSKPYLDAGMPETAMRDLSNFADFSVKYKGKVYPTVENAFQSQKYIYSEYVEPKPKKQKKGEDKNEKETLDEILASFTVDGKMSALDAKKEGGRKAMEIRGYTLDITRWEKESVPLMQELIKSKIERNKEIKKILEVAKEFEVKLAHFSRSDMKWGCHMSEDGTAIKNGKNLLGEIYNNWMYDDESVANSADESEDEKEELLVEKKKEPETIPKPKGPIMFDFDDEDEEEEETGGAGAGVAGAGVAGAGVAKEPAEFLNSDEEEDVEEDEDIDDDADEERLVPDGMPLKPVNPFLKKLRRKDPTLFMSKPSGNFKSFSTSCQPTSRHPVILNQEEMDRTDKSAYKNAIKYGSDPKNPNYFICPRFWCFLTNSAISEEDVKSGKCGAIIPKTADKIPKGSYVYELNKEAQIPGFMENKLANGKCLPCCFKKTWDNKTQTDARKRCESQMNGPDDSDPQQKEDANPKKPNQKQKKQPVKALQYIISLDTYPIPQQRWGFLPIPVQLFFQIDYRPALDPNNPALLQSGKEVFLRYGVEQPLNQSFLGCFADIYAHRQGLDAVPKVDEFRKILIESIHLDVFAKAHNGSLLSAFYPKNTMLNQKRPRVPKEDRKKYKDTEFALALDLTDKAKKRHFDDSILAYENFIAFLSDPEVKMNHQYLWDFVCDDNSRIIPKGLNLVILEIKANDIIDRIELVCPTNLYSRNQYDSAKDTVILLKHDEFYEPIYMYESAASGAPKVTRFFSHGKVPDSVSDMLKRVEHATRKYCPGLPSLPKIYRFSNPVPMQRLLAALVKIGARVESQVVNYQGKTIGLMVVEKGGREAIYVPCAPSARIKLAIKYMDSSNIPKEYEKTMEALTRISTTAKLPCKPVWKIKEDGMVVGFLTETNQFVPIKPNEDIIVDGLQTYEGVDAFAADKTTATEYKGDRTRIKMTKYIVLESQFYHAFRNRVRNLLNQFANRNLKNEIRKITEDKTIIYKQKIDHLENLIERLIDGYVVFVDIAKSVLMDMAEVNECDDDDEGPSCILKENGVAQLVVPKWHLISKYDNEKIYVGRMADELIRNDRIKSIMYDTANRLNAKTTDYKVKDDEFILVQSALTPEYFSELDSTANVNPYAKNTNYELAGPSISVAYPDEKIPLAEQYQPSRQLEDGVGEEEDYKECLVRVSKIIGNQKQVWDRIFSDDAREHIFRDTATCTFIPIIRVAESKLGEKWSVVDIRNKLSAAYLKLFENEPSNLSKVAKILKEQGKSKMFERFTKSKSDATPEEFADIVISDNYHLSDIDIWVIANEYHLPIVVFNANGLKGFFAKVDDTNVNTQWVKMGGNKSDVYHFIRSKIRVAKGTYANHVYEYNLIVPAVKLSQTKEFEGMVVESTRMERLNTMTLGEALERFF